MSKAWLLSSLGTMVLIILMFPWQVLAHGVEGTVQPGGLAVSFRYSTGEAMSYAKVTVLSPVATHIFQMGNTDKNGRFCFYPDNLGEWRVTANDGMGHQLEVKVPVTDKNALDSSPPVAGTDSLADTKGLRVLTGLSVIFGLSGLLFWWQGVRLKRGRRKP